MTFGIGNRVEYVELHREATVIDTSTLRGFVVIRVDGEWIRRSVPLSSIRPLPDPEAAEFIAAMNRFAERNQSKARLSE